MRVRASSPRATKCVAENLKIQSLAHYMGAELYRYRRSNASGGSLNTINWR